MIVRAAIVAIAVLGVAAPARADDRLPVDVAVHRGVGGVVSAGGIEVVDVVVTSRADAPLRARLELDGRDAGALDVAARGRVAVSVARRVAPGISAVPPVAVRVVRGGEVASAEAPSLRVETRPVIVVTDGAAALLPRVDAWRRGTGASLGEPVVIAPDAVPTWWQAFAGVGAIVIDRPIDALATVSADGARTIRRHLAAGGMVCRFDDGAVEPRCARPPPISLPRSRQTAPIAGVARGLGVAALALALALIAAVVIARRWRRAGGAVAIAAVVGAAVLPIALAGGPALAVQGVRVDAGDGEDWIAAEVGASELTSATTRTLGGALWIEVSGATGGGAFEATGLAGRVPGAGSFRVRGFVAGDARGWVDRLERVDRPLPELP